MSRLDNSKLKNTIALRKHNSVFVKKDPEGTRKEIIKQTDQIILLLDKALEKKSPVNCRSCSLATQKGEEK